ncbi:hypothetical protein O3P69_000480 [Scylla paramamosain]|uniref:Uncharacterized protein n=1 Tax=Scylla paramamosain TaxID=85552 RepID=A0AAW0UTC1_SCYPA
MGHNIIFFAPSFQHCPEPQHYHGSLWVSIASSFTTSDHPGRPVNDLCKPPQPPGVSLVHETPFKAAEIRILAFLITLSGRSEPGRGRTDHHHHHLHHHEDYRLINAGNRPRT